MKLFGLSLLVGACSLVSARADLTIVHKVEGIGGGGEMTMKIKGDKMRIEVSPQITTIFDGKTGELTNLMNDQKTVVRISADKMKAAAEMIEKFNSKKESAEKAKLVPTGKKETINGYETEQYACDGPSLRPPTGSRSTIPTALQSSNNSEPSSRKLGTRPIRTCPIIAISLGCPSARTSRWPNRIRELSRVAPLLVAARKSQPHSFPLNKIRSATPSSLSRRIIRK